MLFVIHALDHEVMVEKRLELIGAHRDYAAKSDVKIAISGPLTADDGETVIGSLLIVDVENRAEAEDFAKHYPLAKAGIWKQLDITAFQRRVG